MLFACETVASWPYDVTIAAGGGTLGMTSRAGYNVSGEHGKGAAQSEEHDESRLRAEECSRDGSAAEPPKPLATLQKPRKSLLPHGKDAVTTRCWALRARGGSRRVLAYYGTKSAAQRAIEMYNESRQISEHGRRYPRPMKPAGHVLCPHPCSAVSP